MMAKRVFNDTITIAPERILKRYYNVRAQTNGTFEDLVGILDIEVNRHR
jgi:hypothetical protein